MYTPESTIVVDEYFNWATLYVSGCYIVNSSIKNPTIYNTASFSLIDTGKKKLGVTNDHVLQEFSNYYEKYENVEFYVGSFPFKPFELLISRSDSLDLATFDFENVSLHEIGNNHQFCTIQNWPPERVGKDDIVVYSGYPSQFVRKGTPEVLFHSISCLDIVKSYDDRKFTTFRDPESPKYGKISVGVDLNEFKKQGGFSGTLVLHVPRKDAVHHVVPCGIIYKGGDSFGHITFIRHIDFINADGTIQ